MPSIPSRTKQTKDVGAPHFIITQDDSPLHSAHDESNWLVSYADMMTLLCGFFIIMFSLAKIDPPKFDILQEQLAKQTGAPVTSPTKEMGRFVTSLLDQADVKKYATITTEPGEANITFQSTLFFNTLSATLLPEGENALKKIIEHMKQSEGDRRYNIVVEGHTDSRPITDGPYPSNWELSSARASTVIRLFIAQGYAPERLTAIGYADTRPAKNAEKNQDVPTSIKDSLAATKDSLAAMQGISIINKAPLASNKDLLAANRRVIIKVLDPRLDAIPMQKMPIDVPPQTGKNT